MSVYECPDCHSDNCPSHLKDMIADLQTENQKFREEASAAYAHIAAWLRGGANDVRARGTLAFEESIMPIYRELADLIEKRKWK
jgi:hypothetical protein